MRLGRFGTGGGPLFGSGGGVCCGNGTEFDGLSFRGGIVGGADRLLSAGLGFSILLRLDLLVDGFTVGAEL